MNILLDECLPKRLGSFLPGFNVRTVRQMNWQGLKNGDLLNTAEGGFDVFITVDKSLAYQQNLTGRRIAIVMLRSRSNDIDALTPLAPRILDILATIEPGSFHTIDER
jgi:predicted nuclease of predicted toxin-antitoxin system